MELILQQDLPHQQKAIDAVCGVLDGVHISAPTQFYKNPKIHLDDPKISANLREIQMKIPIQHRGTGAIGACLQMDAKMETGTGKTYVYTKTIYEMHKRYGLNKFIIVVPSLTIKAGTKQFLEDDYVRRHFTDSCGYGAEIESLVVDSPKNKKKGRNPFPGVVKTFVKGSCHDRKKIYVLLLNMQLLTGAQLLTRADYDNGPEGFYRPMDAMAATDPVVMIDEPHRFSRDQKAFQAIMNGLRPQCLIRYGATFPEVTSGRGKNKVVWKDYQNLLYDLNACESFNLGLIKGVAKEHFEPPSKQDEMIKVLSVESKTAVTLQRIKGGESAKSYRLQAGDSLALVNDVFEGITVQAIGKSWVEFSNGVVKNTGETMDVNIYMTSYQEQMLRLALQRHFEAEKENFCGRTFKIKTLALFFIDDIGSYRQSVTGKETYLIDKFDRLLREQINETLQSLTERDSEYRAYLEASLSDIPACRAAYFSQDANDSDESIAQEVYEILHGKKQLLSFFHRDGSYNTRRFLFSKWTLKEGWDNPNVFTIVKLRSSGSEISKLQEVGRGLRLPVDENGNRVSDEEFRLNYIVDFTERNFAQELVDQINGEIPEAACISEERLAQVAQQLGMESADDLFDVLYGKGYIDRHNNIKLETKEEFFEEYPMFRSGISPNKVRDNNREAPKPIKIRKDVYKKLQPLWEKLNQRYTIAYDGGLNVELDDVVLSIFEMPGVFTDVVLQSRRDIVEGQDGQMSLSEEAGVQYEISQPIPYGEFLKRIVRATNLPIGMLHQALIAFVKAHGTIDPRAFNGNSASEFCSRFHTWKVTHLQERFHYEKSASTRRATALSYPDGSPREEIAQGRIGTKIVPGTPNANYLYDVYAYDSPLERDNMVEIDSVVAYGKIPRNSIAIPTIAGGTYSPDFVYVLNQPSGEETLDLMVETKDVDSESELREEEVAKIQCAKKFCETLSEDGFTVHFQTQLHGQRMDQVINRTFEAS